jgi:hypothetical protein
MLWIETCREAAKMVDLQTWIDWSHPQLIGDSMNKPKQIIDRYPPIAMRSGTGPDPMPVFDKASAHQPLGYGGRCVTYTSRHMGTLPHPATSCKRSYLR